MRQMKPTRLTYALALCLMGTLASCTQTTQPAAPKLSAVLAELTGQNGRACVRSGNIRGFAANEDSININAGRRYYVATTLFRCNNLDLSPVAVFSSRFAELCGGTGRMFIPGETCQIDKIFEFDNRKSAHSTLDQAEQQIDDFKQAQREAAASTQ